MTTTCPRNEPIITEPDDLDWYKFTMSRLWWHKFPTAQGVFELTNRTKAVRLLDYIDPQELRDQLSYVAGFRFQDSHTSFIYSQGIQNPEFLRFLQSLRLPMPEVGYANNDLYVSVQGELPVVTLWETIVLAIVKQLYVEGWCRANGVTEADLAREGARRLDEKIQLMLEIPEPFLSEFGTRRRASFANQLHVVERLEAAMPDRLIGTSNVAIARTLGLPVSGTVAHEMDMGYAALHNDLDPDNLWSGSIGSWAVGQSRLMDDMEEVFGAANCVGLADTFGFNYFFRNFRSRAHWWKGVRHDSGDPFAFGERVIGFYEGLGIDPRTKLIVFSDGLDMQLTLRLYRRFAGRIKVAFGIGTNLSDDRGGAPQISLVMKLAEVNGIRTLKLSENLAKAMGRPEDIERARIVYDHSSTHTRECVV